MLKKTILTVCMAAASLCAQAVDKTHFYTWLSELKAEAKADSISPKTIKSTFKNAKYLPQVIVLDRAQDVYKRQHLLQLSCW